MLQWLSRAVLSMRHCFRSADVSIDRKQWIHGEGLSASSLLRERDGKRCCLGFFCQSLGIPDEEMLSVVQPGLLPSVSQKIETGILPAWLFEDQSHVRCFPPMPSQELQE